MKRNIKELLDITKIPRQEAYSMYIRGIINRDEMYDYLHERMMWLLDEDKKNNEDEK
jgi:hypothetical protein